MTRLFGPGHFRSVYFSGQEACLIILHCTNIVTLARHHDVPIVVTLILLITWNCSCEYANVVMAIRYVTVKANTRGFICGTLAIMLVHFLAMIQRQDSRLSL